MPVGVGGCGAGSDHQFNAVHITGFNKIATNSKTSRRRRYSQARSLRAPALTNKTLSAFRGVKKKKNAQSIARLAHCALYQRIALMARSALRSWFAAHCAHGLQRIALIACSALRSFLGAALTCRLIAPCAHTFSALSSYFQRFAPNSIFPRWSLNTAPCAHM